MLTNTFMNNNQSILKNNKVLADLSINRNEANNLTNNETIENKNKKPRKSPNKKSQSFKIY